jgi:hypothetical protein
MKLSGCLLAGGLTGMLALHGIFVLVTQHGLEYPAFYKRLYNLFNQDAFAAKHRPQVGVQAGTSVISYWQDALMA